MAKQLRPAAGEAGTRLPGVKDVAAAAGVSPGTVSNVMNRPEIVRAETRERVELTMAKLGFVRNESARHLRAGTSRQIAYLMLDATNPFFADVAKGMDEVAEAAGLSLFLCTSEQRAEREQLYLESLEQQRVRGLLITPVDPDSPSLDALTDRGTPVVLVDHASGQARRCSVTVDDLLGGRLAVEHLLDLGHQRIAFVGGPDRLDQVRDRRTGAREALSNATGRGEELLLLSTDAASLPEGRLAASRIAGMVSAVRPTAAFCANDLLALGLLQGCVSLGLRVPEDLAIVGYDDIDFASAATVPLTSVRQPRRLMGRTAVELLLDETSNAGHEHQQVQFAPELVARASTRRWIGLH